MLKTTKEFMFSGHETFPLRQLWLRKAYDSISLSDTPAAKSIFTDHESIVRFGVGKNMVSSIKHWALATHFMEEQDAGYKPTAQAELLFGNNGLDLYSEHPATIWLIHWNLAGRGRRSTTWFWVFNHIQSQTFTRDDIFRSLKEFTLSNNIRATEVTLKRDIECFIKSYVPNIGGDSAEDIAEPILGELGLIQQSSRGLFEFRRGSKHTLPDGLFAYALLDFWSRRAPDLSTLSFDSVAQDFGSPGKVFKLDENGIADRFMNIEDITKGAVTWSDTAGMRQLIKTKPVELNTLLKAAYD